MKRYVTIINIFWQRALTYRFTVMAYRIGEALEMIVLVLMWGAIYQHSPVIGGLTYPEMITYLMIGNLFGVMIRNFLPEVVARDIQNGTLSLFLVQPMDYFVYVLTKEIGRISVSTILSVLTQIFIAIFFFKILVFNFDPLSLGVIFLMLIFAFVTELLIAFLSGLIAFWTTEVDGLYASIDRLEKFFAGGYFPLSLLPKAFVSLSFLLPFAYTFYVPTQLYLRKISIYQALQGLLVQLMWVGILGVIITLVWKKGVKKFEGIGI